MKLDGSNIIVTGANRGIGRAVVLELIKSTTARIYAAARNTDALQDLVALGNGRVLALELDITDSESVSRAAIVATDVNIVINNAGALQGGSQLSADLSAIRSNFETNYFGTLNVVRAFTPALERNGNGLIVNVLSVASFVNVPSLGAYSASKAASHSLTLGLRGELGKKGIEVYGVYPGPIDTDMAKDLDMVKTSPAEAAAEIVAGIVAGSHYILPDATAKQVYSGWKADHAAVEAQFGAW